MKTVTFRGTNGGAFTLEVDDVHSISRLADQSDDVTAIVTKSGTVVSVQGSLTEVIAKLHRALNDGPEHVTVGEIQEAIDDVYDDEPCHLRIFRSHQLPEVFYGEAAGAHNPDFLYKECNGDILTAIASLKPEPQGEPRESVTWLSRFGQALERLELATGQTMYVRGLGDGSGKVCSEAMHTTPVVTWGAGWDPIEMIDNYIANSSPERDPLQESHDDLLEMLKPLRPEWGARYGTRATFDPRIARAEKLAKKAD